MSKLKDFILLLICIILSPLFILIAGLEEMEDS